MHLDRNPVDPFMKQTNSLLKWRPIQAFVCLTDHFTNESGGLCVVEEFHKEIDNYFKDLKNPGKGEFYRLNQNTHAKLYKRNRFVYAPKGSLVCWDNSLPHSTCNKLTTGDTREVVYIDSIPNVDINTNYIKKQWKNLCNNEAPPAYYCDGICDRNYEINYLSNRQKRLLGCL